MSVMSGVSVDPSSKAFTRNATLRRKRRLLLIATVIALDILLASAAWYAVGYLIGA
jgi:hypothetical protein